ncbi:MAG: DUF3168 domain-containing protein [Devosiaceae bacterium]|nr:DUF3168 domain-containing protein [Devosiaceae bacterium]
MAHSIIELQTNLVTALKADAQLLALLGNGVFDAPPKGRKAPFVAIIRHDVISRDGDETPGFEHRILLHARHDDVSRKAVLEIVERVIFIALNEDLSSASLLITHVQHDKIETRIDGKSGQAVAAISLRFLSEPTI